MPLPESVRLAKDAIARVMREGLLVMAVSAALGVITALTEDPATTSAWSEGQAPARPASGAPWQRGGLGRPVETEGPTPPASYPGIGIETGGHHRGDAFGEGSETLGDPAGLVDSTAPACRRP